MRARFTDGDALYQHVLKEVRPQTINPVIEAMDGLETLLDQCDSRVSVERIGWLRSRARHLIAVLDDCLKPAKLDEEEPR